MPRPPARRRSDPLIHNPALLERTELIQGFVLRRDLLAEVVTQIRTEPDGTGLRHLLLIGQRGMGKTTLLLRLRYFIEDDPDLRGTWQPVLFQEEQHHIGDLADLWLETLRDLAEQWDDRDLGARADDLLSAGWNEDGLVEEAYRLLVEACQRRGRRVLLLLDNINTILANLDEREAHWLRKILMLDGCVLVIGAATSYFSAVSHQDQPFYEFFRTYRLDALTVEEMGRLILHTAESSQDHAVSEALSHDPQRVVRLRLLTGGNPRTTLLIYRLLAEFPGGAVRQDIERLLDDVTPFYKHQIEALRPPQQRLLQAVARHWHPVQIDTLARALRIPGGKLQGGLDELVTTGFIEEVEISEGRRAYQVAERLYNIYFLMRFSRTGRQDLRWLMSFVDAFFGSQGLPSLTEEQKWPDALDQIGVALKSINPPDIEKEVGTLLHLLHQLAPHLPAADLLAVLDATPDLKLRQRWLPFAAALEVKAGGNIDRLKDLAPEVRGIAEEILHRWEPEQSRLTRSGA